MTASGGWYLLDWARPPSIATDVGKILYFLNNGNSLLAMNSISIEPTNNNRETSNLMTVSHFESTEWYQREEEDGESEVK